MSRNGSGTYLAPVNSWNQAINDVLANPADWQAILNDISSALSQSLSKDGQTALTGNLPMGGNKLTGLLAGSSSGDSASYDQLFSLGLPANVPSASVVQIGAVFSTVIDITGTVTITSFGTNYNGPRFIRFADSLLLTHNASTLILPGEANITTSANDCLIAVPSGVPVSGWRVIGYFYADGRSLFAENANTAVNALACSGNAATATLLQTGRAFSTLGDVTGTSSTFNGSSNANIPTTLIDARKAAGDGQTWQNLTGSRSLGTTYTNSSGRIIQIKVTGTITPSGVAELYVGSELVDQDGSEGSNRRGTLSATVPIGATYRALFPGGSLIKWCELTV